MTYRTDERLVSKFVQMIYEHDPYLAKLVGEGRMRHARGYLWLEFNGEKTARVVRHKMKLLKSMSDGLFYRNRKIFIGFN